MTKPQFTRGPFKVGADGETIVLEEGGRALAKTLGGALLRVDARLFAAAADLYSANDLGINMLAIEARSWRERSEYGKAEAIEGALGVMRAARDKALGTADAS